MKTFYNAMRAEWIKMWSVRSTLIYTIIIAVSVSYTHLTLPTNREV